MRANFEEVPHTEYNSALNFDKLYTDPATAIERPKRTREVCENGEAAFTTKIKQQ